MNKLQWLTILIVIQAFTGSTPFTIECEFFAGFLEYLGSYYECNTTITFTSSDHTITGVTGTHVAEKNNDDVSEFWIEGKTNLKFMPRGITKFFPNIKGLCVRGLGIDSFSGDEFNEFGQQLLWLGITYSNVTTLPSSLFKATPNLIVLDLRNNRIERIGHELFAPLNQIKELDFDHNPCVNRYAANPTAIQALIGDLRELCPYEDEVLSVTIFAGAPGGHDQSLCLKVIFFSLFLSAVIKIACQ